jgi:hypothetical protein
MPYYKPSCDIDYDIKAIIYDYSDNKYHTLYFKYKKILWWKKQVLIRESVDE